MDHIHLAAPSRPTLTEAALCAWVGQATAGDQLIYHRGFLAFDTGPDGQVLTPAERQQVRRVADRAYQLFKDGLVHLVQRREAPGEYSYIVIARTRPRVGTGALKVILEQAGLSDLRRSA